MSRPEATAASTHVPTISVDRSADGLRLRLERPARGEIDPLQEEYLQPVDAAGLAALLASADDLLRGEARAGFLDEARRRGAVLHRTLVPEPLATQLKAIHGPLLVRTSVYGIPWELLHDGEEFWGMRYALGRRLITARPLGRRVEDVRLPVRPRTLVIGADPRGDLPLVAEEIETVATALAPRSDVTCIAGALAGFDAVVDNLGQGFHLVHFAGHVVVGDEGRPGLLLGDGRVLPADMIAPALRGHPVVVVNGCGSVRGGSGGTQGGWEQTLSGVAHGFLFGGALAVVGTLAEVSDRHAATLARAFYRLLLAPETVGEALRRARSELRDDPGSAQSPAWLSFVLYGNPAVTVVSDAAARTDAGRGAAGLTRRMFLVGGAVLGLGAAAMALRGRWLRPRSPAVPVVVGVMAARAAAGTVPDWMREFARHALNTTLTEIAGVSVFSQEKIDFLCQSRGLCGIAGAEALGMAKMITPSLSVVGDRVALEVEVIDVARNGLLELTERVQGPQARLIELQNTLVLRVLERLGVEPSPEARARILGERTNDMLDSYRMLVETLGGHGAGALPPESRGRAPRWLAMVAEARAEDPPAEAAVRSVLQAYAAALAARDVDAVANLQVKVSEEQRAALRRYFGHAANLEVVFSNVEVLVSGSQALASYVREDRFTDARTGQPMHLKVTLSTRLTKVDGAWRLDLSE